MAVVADRIRARLESRSWQRFHCALIVTLAAASAFLASRLLLRLRVGWMAWRYALAALAGYGVFLLMIRLWVLWKSSRLEGNDDGGQAGKAAVDAFVGGRSGGGGAAMSFEPAPQVQPVAVANASTSSGFSLDIDGDDLFWLIVAVAATFAGVVAVSYLVWVAPTFLGEAAVNAAVAGKVYHGMQRRDSSHWTEDQFKRTIVPVLIVVVTAAVTGYAFNRIAPEAVTVGGVSQHLAAK